MLKPKQIDELPEALVELYSKVEMDIIADMARRISGMDYFISAAQWQYRKLVEMGNCHGWIMQALSAQTGKTRAEIERMMEEAGAKAIHQDVAIYKRAGLSPPELAASPALQAVLIDGIRNTEGLFTNLTGTTANTATKQFERALDRAWLQVQSGAFSQEDAIRTAIKDLAKKGVECIAYPSGHVDHMDVAVRRAAVTGANQAALRLQDALADEMGSDLVEVTAHSGARPEHALWQGKVFSRSGTHPKYPDFRSSTGYGTGSGLGGWNCRHSWFVFFEGISDPAYTADELEDMNAPKYTYNGEKLTEYEASQKQRAIERNIRRWKREYKAMEASGLDTSEAAAKLSRWQEKQKDFLFQTGMKRQTERERVEGFGRREAARANVAVKRAKAENIAVLENTAKWPANARGKLKQDEAMLSKREKEAAVLYDGNGKTILTKTGTEQRVSFSKLEVKMMKGGILTHNHPYSTTFSWADIDMLRRSQLSEIRATGNTGTFFMRQPARWPEEIGTTDKINKAYEKIETKVEPIIAKRLESGQIDVVEYNQIYQMHILDVFASKYGIEYGFELR